MSRVNAQASRRRANSQLSRRILRRSAIYCARMPSFPPLRCVLACAVLIGAAACHDAVPDSAHPPDADFVLSAGDSSYWVTSAGGSLRFRGAPLELARVDGRFYELYVADDDRSYEDAVLIGQRIY